MLYLGSPEKIISSSSKLLNVTNKVEKKLVLKSFSLTEKKQNLCFYQKYDIAAESWDNNVAVF